MDFRSDLNRSFTQYKYPSPWKTGYYNDPTSSWSCPPRESTESYGFSAVIPNSILNPIFNVIKRKNMHDLQNLLNTSMTCANMVDEDKKSVLTHAASHGWTAGVKCLLKNGALQGAKMIEDLPLRLAIIGENVSMVVALVDNIKKIPSVLSHKQIVDCLEVASRCKDAACERSSWSTTEIYNTVSQLYALYNPAELIKGCFYAPHANTFKHLLETSGMSPQKVFYEMLLHGVSMSALRVIFEHGVDLSDPFISTGFLFRKLVQDACYVELEFLGERGARFDAMRADGTNYLHIALTSYSSETNRVFLIRCLVRYGADPNQYIVGKRMSALKTALCTYRSAFTCELLNEENTRPVNGNLNSLIMQAICDLVFTDNLERLTCLSKESIKHTYHNHGRNWLVEKFDKPKTFSFLLSCGIDINFHNCMVTSVKRAVPEYRLQRFGIWLALGVVPSSIDIKHIIMVNPLYLEQLLAHGHLSIFLNTLTKNDIFILSQINIFAYAKFVITELRVNIFTDPHWQNMFEEYLILHPNLDELVELANNLPVSLQHLCWRKIRSAMIFEENTKNAQIYLK